MSSCTQHTINKQLGGVSNHTQQLGVLAAGGLSGLLQTWMGLAGRINGCIAQHGYRRRQRMMAASYMMV
jgi:hypothetical protein